MAQAFDAQRTLETAVAQFQSGDLNEAATLCTALLDELPAEPNALQILGAIRLRQNDPETAISILQTAADAAPEKPEILINLGAAYRASGDPVKAVGVLKTAVGMAPQNPSAHLNLGNACVAASDPDGALTAYRQVLDLQPDHTGARQALAEILCQTGHTDEALLEYQMLDRAAPGNPETLNAMGALYADTGDLEKAEPLFRDAMLRDRSNIDIAANLANVLAGNFRHDEALGLYRDVVARAPDNPDLLCNMGNALSRSGANDEARQFYRDALTIDPDHLDANASLANSLLADGDFDSGWKHFLKRASTLAIAQRVHRVPLEEDLGGTHVSVMGDQGLGDQIFFARFLPELRNRGAQVTYRPQPRLVAMLERSGIADNVIDPGLPLTGDLTVSGGDLPYLLAVDGSGTQPQPFPIPPAEQNLSSIRETFAAFGPPPYIGITWRAGTANLRRALSKEAPFAEFARILSDVSATVVLVQRNIKPEEAAAFEAILGRPALDMSGANDDLEDLLALSALLDSYVGVSNTMTHMRAACGRASHVFVPVPADFRWMKSGDTSPWFPDSPIYRQTTGGKWSDAFDRLARYMGK